MPESTFAKLSSLCTSHVLRATNYSAWRLRERTRVTEKQWAARPLYELFLSLASLVARQRYGEHTVRAVVTAVARESSWHLRLRPGIADAAFVVRSMEQDFLDGDSEAEGLRRMCNRAAFAVSERAVWHGSRTQAARALNNLIVVLFGDAGRFALDQPSEDVADCVREVTEVLLPIVGDQRLVLDHLFSTRVMSRLTVRTLRADCPLAAAAELRLPADFNEGAISSTDAACYAVSYDVSGESGMLAEGTEVHVAPRGAREAVSDSYYYLRHHWYPLATLVTITSIERIPLTNLSELRRNYWVKFDTGGGRSSALAHGRTREEALDSIRQYFVGLANPEFHEFHQVVSGRPRRSRVNLADFYEDPSLVPKRAPRVEPLAGVSRDNSGTNGSGR